MEEPTVNPGWRKASDSANGGTACVEVGSIPWRKASDSGNGGTDCVEIGSIPWRKASYSANGGTSCVEAGHVPGAVLIRDTKNNGDGPVLRLTPADWHRFTATIRTSEPIG